MYIILRVFTDQLNILKREQIQWKMWSEKKKNKDHIIIILINVDLRVLVLYKFLKSLWKVKTFNIASHREEKKMFYCVSFCYFIDLCSFIRESNHITVL